MSITMLSVGIRKRVYTAWVLTFDGADCIAAILWIFTRACALERLNLFTQPLKGTKRKMFMLSNYTECSPRLFDVHMEALLGDVAHYLGTDSTMAYN